MRKGSRAVFIAAFVFGAVVGHCARTCAEEWVTGNMLLQSIKSENKSENTLALGYIMGVHDRAETVSSCTPPGVTAPQIVDLVIKYMILNPEHRHYSADRIVSTVLMKHFPCPETLEGPSVEG